jgi:serine/threonine protein phosphatase PrpC
MAKDRGTTASLTDVGQVRNENQDSFAVRELPEARFLVVADGMGGHLGGSLASRICVETVTEEVEGSEIQWNDPHQVRSLLEQALLRANTEVFRAAQANTEAYNMGTTALLVAIVGNQAYIAHVGDSRLYLLRGSKAVRLTTDHTSAQVLLEAGRLTAEEVRDHPESHRLMRAIGVMSQVEPDVRREAVELRFGDVLLLCSDGLYDVVEGREMAIAARKFEPDKACTRLVELANNRGGPDNVTVVLYRREEPDSPFVGLAPWLKKEIHGVPRYLWGVAAGALAIAATLLALSFVG